MMTDKKETERLLAVKSSILYEEIAAKSQEVLWKRKQGGFITEDKMEYIIEERRKYLKQENIFLSLPFAAMQDTIYGKKAHYYELVNQWKECHELEYGWALLALVNTLEQMAEAIYEYYRSLGDLFLESAKRFLLNVNETMDREDIALGALSVLKACKMEILPCQGYAEKAIRLFEDNALETQVRELYPIAQSLWIQIKEQWGAEAERIWKKNKEKSSSTSHLNEKRKNDSCLILHKTARSIVLELLGEDIYETEEYEIWVNGVFVKTDNRMVTILNGLCPKTMQRIEIRRKDGTVISLETETEYEYVTLNVRRFGAKGDGIADDTAAIQAAILSCPKHSRVYIPEGTYRIRNLFLKSDVIFEIGKGAFLQGFQEREDFPVLPGRTESFDGKEEYILGTWEGNPLPSMASIINGIHVENVVICGEGTIDGGGNFDKWWVNGINSYPPYRPKTMFFNHCKNITVEGIRIQNSPSWNIHPFFCESIKVYGIELESPDRSHNTDGIDPESCTGVEIVGVHFSVGDDCIAIKSGKIYMGKTYKRPSRDIHIRQCLMEKGHGAVTIGSEIAGGVFDVTITKCLFQDTDRGLRIKTRRGRGQDSIVDGISFDTIQMDQVKSPFVVNCFYYCDPDGKSDYVASQEALPVDERTPKIRRLTFSNIVCRNAHHTGVCIYGLPEQKVEEVAMNHVQISYAPDAKEGIAAMMRECKPSCRQGIFVKNVKRLVLNGVRIEGAESELEWESVDEMIVR